MIEHVITVDDFPKWALPVLINDDCSSLNLYEVIEVDKFLESFKEVTHWDVDDTSLEGGSFNRYPAFGLAANCCTIKGYAEKRG